MSKNKIVLFLIAPIILAAVFSFVNVAQAAPSCSGRNMTFREYNEFKKSGKVSASLRIDGSKTVASVRNSTNCLLPLTLETYKMFDTVLEHQTRFDSSYVVVKANSSSDIRANLPGCMAQIDLYVGNGPVDMDSLGHAGNLILWLFDQNQGTSYNDARGNFCGQPESLVVNCSANPSSVSRDGSIAWTANATGGTGTYFYSWSGTDSLFGTSRIINKIYNVAGNKTATVTVTSGNKTRTATCNASVTENINPLTVSCSANPSSVRKNESVVWNASASGGTGSYSYNWSGSDNLYGYGSTVYKNYYNTGSKNATITVTSDGQSASANCYVNVFEDNIPQNLDAYCSVSPYNAQVGTNVTWNVTAYGGSGYYYYNWSGTDGLYGTGSSINKTYSYPGYKTATVTISSGSQSITKTCNTNIGQVLAYNQTNNLPTLTSVYLSDIPYTGIGDGMNILAFVLALIGFSSLVAYGLLKNKKELVEAPVVGRTEIKDIPQVMTDMADKIRIDKELFSAVEDIALSKKIVISASATESLVRKVRLSGNSLENIAQELDNNRSNKKCAEGDWCTIGEEEIK